MEGKGVHRLHSIIHQRKASRAQLLLKGYQTSDVIKNFLQKADPERAGLFPHISPVNEKYAVLIPSPGKQHIFKIEDCRNFPTL